MDKMKVSVCITLYNEENSILKLLESLLSQNKLPNEIVIVDGGSTDRTFEKLLAFSRQAENNKRKVKFKIIQNRNARRSKGRNIAVKKSKNGIIAMTDADCIADKNWLLRLIKPFENPHVDMVAGFYKMVGKTNFQKALIPFLGVTPQKFSSNFLPSTRSIAFRKRLWQEIGGFYENDNKNTAEDTFFNYDALKNNAYLKRAKGAIVLWEVPRDLRRALVKFFNYANWDAKHGIWWHPLQKFKTHNIKVLTIFFRYFIFFLFPVIFPVYLFWAFSKTFRTGRVWKVGLWGIIIQVTSDLAIMLGFLAAIYGLFSKVH